MPGLRFFYKSNGLFRYHVHCVLSMRELFGFPNIYRHLCLKKSTKRIEPPFFAYHKQRNSIMEFLCLLHFMKLYSCSACVPCPQKLSLAPMGASMTPSLAGYPFPHENFQTLGHGDLFLRKPKTHPWIFIYFIAEKIYRKKYLLLLSRAANSSSSLSAGVSLKTEIPDPQKGGRQRSRSVWMPGRE